MAGNPLVPQGTLNRLRGSITFQDHPELNITASFLGPEGINLNPEGDINPQMETMTGTVGSPVPFQMFTVEVELLKTQPLSDAFKQQLETDSGIGAFTVRPDASTLSPYPILNGVISQASPGRINGTAVGFVVSLRGYYLVNQALFDAA